jgi:DeoR/GlpR family transcriptional regulator of sugar metabolism
MTLRHREEALVVRAMVEGAGRVISLATAGKLGSTGPYPVAAIERIDTLVSDAPDDDLQVYRDLGVEVLRAAGRLAPPAMVQPGRRAEAKA